MKKTYRFSSKVYFLVLSIATILFILSVAFKLGASIPAEKRPLMRFPDVHENTVVFVYGEDIWSVPAEGGVAVRLTIHDGQERFPRISPDGTMIAFTGEYDGNADVYVMSIHGGDITRVTYHPGYDEVVGWHPVKNKILFTSTRHSYSRFSRLFLISPDGTGLEELILHEATQGSFSPDGTKIAYNKVSRENRTWKRYRGGTAQEIYLYDFTTNEDRNISNFEGTDRIPMWIGDKIYFSSDRDGMLNIYSYDTKTEKIKQITNHKEYDVRRPSMDKNKIIYELGGSLWLLDVNSEESQQIPVEIRTDVPEVRPYFKKVDQHITGFDCSPSGKRALIVARGEVFSVPRKEGPTRNLTKDSGSRDKDAVWSPDGKKIAYLSDKNGEYEIYIVDPMGKKEAIQLTKHENGYRHSLRWSPDSKKIAFADQTLRFYFLDVETKKITEVDKALYENVDVSLNLKPIYDFSWSPDSRFLTYSKMDEDLVYKVYIYSLDTGEIHCVSNGIFNDFGPVFSEDGEHLFFISNRRFDPTFCDFEWEMVYKKVAGIYCLTLRRDGKPLLPYKSDEEGTENEKTAKEKNSEKELKAKEARIIIDFEGIAERIEPLPLPRGNYRNLSATKSEIFYLNAVEGDFNRFEFREKGPQNLHAFSFDTRKERTVISGIRGYKLSADGKHIIYQKDKTIGIIDASATNSKGEPLNLSDLKIWLDPMKEWKQIFDEAWRMERDFYYEPNMHGIDWVAMKEKYGRLLPYASCRQDIQYIVGELIGELNTSHTYVFGGDRLRQVKQVNVGLLGVDWEIDTASNRYRIKKICRTPDWTRQVLPPLAIPGVNVQEGYYVLQVNGEEVLANRNIYSYFLGLAGKQVSLLVNDKPSYAGAKEIVVKPLGNEYILRYLDWVEHNRLLVEEKSNGQIGYIHLPDTYLGSAAEFPKYFYSQMSKKGLIIDGRFNGGGLDPDIFLRRLDKKLHAYWTRRYSHDQTIPDFVTRAHMVCLTNKQAGSGGDMLPFEFKKRGMGPVIGTRTWGGLVGVSMWIDLIDGGGLSAPDYRIYDTDGKWVVENVGVQPDIVIDLHPAEMAQGYDAQLMKGIEVLMKKIKEDPRPWPKHEPFPKDKK
ncbi:MAG: PD40 domain-containing protein [Candidatus Aminicenantes bacterium]|nr:PD40 domain-containing protein [Candidatus Aminicenantes bacterium]